MSAPNRAQRRQLSRDNAKLPNILAPVPAELWPDPVPAGLRQAWRSRDYLVQAWDAPAPAKLRLSISLTTLNSSGRWADGLSWDELQDIKAQCGFPLVDAVEIYPSSIDVVNVANMRHLWLMEGPLTFAWRRT